MIYRENGRRYIPIKFSVRGRDLATTIQDLQRQLANKIKLPSGYNYTWAGEFDSLRKEQRRLAFIIPVSLVAILILLYIQFRTWKDALIVLGTLPFGAIGGVLALFSHPHTVQHFGRGWVHFADRGCHLGCGRLSLWHPPCPSRRWLRRGAEKRLQ